jgi:hypothetical protein
MKWYELLTTWARTRFLVSSTICEGGSYISEAKLRGRHGKDGGEIWRLVRFGYLRLLEESEVAELGLEQETPKTDSHEDAKAQRTATATATATENRLNHERHERHEKRNR